MTFNGLEFFDQIVIIRRYAKLDFQWIKSSFLNLQQTTKDGNLLVERRCKNPLSVSSAGNGTWMEQMEILDKLLINFK